MAVIGLFTTASLQGVHHDQHGDVSYIILSRLWIHNTPPLSSARLSQTDLVTLKRKTVLQKAVPSVLRLVERPIDRTSAYRGGGALSDPGPVRPRLHTTPPPSSTFFDRFGTFCGRVQDAVRDFPRESAGRPPGECDTFCGRVRYVQRESANIARRFPGERRGLACPTVFEDWTGSGCNIKGAGGFC
ncbi:hypothetical protein Bbelb_373250 [Branchiostoma belcheri]|nr:hypothetical protein Bbelb_373250 [Branchiostoma belcheri]